MTSWHPDCNNPAAAVTSWVFYPNYFIHTRSSAGYFIPTTLSTQLLFVRYQLHLHTAAADVVTIRTHFLQVNDGRQHFLNINNSPHLHVLLINYLHVLLINQPHVRLQTTPPVQFCNAAWSVNFKVTWHKNQTNSWSNLDTVLYFKNQQSLWPDTQARTELQ